MPALHEELETVIIISYNNNIKLLRITTYAYLDTKNILKFQVKSVPNTYT